MKTDEFKYCYRYPHAAITADCVIFGFDGQVLKLLLVERGLEPYKGMWALPGGFMRIDESIDCTARRELLEETGLSGIYMEQFHVFSSVERDPRERVVTVAFIALVRPELYELCAGDDASDAQWFNAEMLPPMAFDHAEIIAQARQYLCDVLRVKPIAFELLNKYFSLSELQRVYEAITGNHYDRRNFQRKALQTGLLHEVSKPEPSFAESDTKTTQLLSPPHAARKKLPGRNANRFFQLFKNEKDASATNEEEDASTKDLFNF